nr:DeoR family transcriptional regulator [Rhizobium jaguaris]
MSLSHNRHKKLIEMVQTDGEVRIRDLMLHFNISEETARRDINQHRAAKCTYPALVGRHVCCGFRQSSPDRR